MVTNMRCPVLIPHQKMIIFESHETDLQISFAQYFKCRVSTLTFPLVAIFQQI